MIFLCNHSFFRQFVLSLIVGTLAVHISKRSTMEQGTVKFFNETKGFGFITPTNGGADIFVHVSGLKSDTIRMSDKVTYEIEQGPKGLAAINVKKV